MICTLFAPRYAVLLGLGALAFSVSLAARGDSQTAERPARVDRTKNEAIERPAKVVVAERSAPAVARDFANPKVLPGKVRWHPSFTAACEAARRSGKPVLLFQMMGKLDDQFC
jgi:hypothetical protein